MLYIYKYTYIYIYIFIYINANNMLDNPLGILGLGGTIINVTIGNILGMRIVSKNIYLDIFMVGNIQVSLSR